MNTNIQILWNEWKTAIDNIVSQDNQYYTLIDGITNADSNMYAQLDNEIRIPEELLEFYRIQNHQPNYITSAFSFTIDGVWYQIIPFKWIREEWQGIQDLYFGDDLADDAFEDFSEKVKADDYANPRWIPFANGDQGDYLLFDTDPSDLGTYGQIIELQNESWERNVIANSLEELLQMQIEQTKKGKPKNFWNFILNKEKDDSITIPHDKLKKLLRTVKYSSIKDRMPANSWTHQEYEKNPDNDPDILYFNGNLEIDYIDLSQPLIEYEKRNEDYETYLREQSSFLIFIDGDLNLNNLFSSNEDGAMSLIVAGSVNAKNMIVGGGEIIIMSDLNVKDLLWGHYNHGSLIVDLEIFARVIIMTEQYGFDEEINSYLSEYYFNEESEDYEDDIEYYLEIAEALFEPQHLEYQFKDVTDDDYEDIYGWASIVNREEVINSIKEDEFILKRVFEHPEQEKLEGKSKVIQNLNSILKITIPNNKEKRNRLKSQIKNLNIEEYDWDNPQVILDILTHISSTEYPSILFTFDANATVTEVSNALEQAIKENFDTQNFSLPKENEYANEKYYIADVFVDFEIALRKIDTMYQSGLVLTFLQIDSDKFYFILHDETDKWIIKEKLEDLGIKSHFKEKEYLEKNDHRNVSKIFTNKIFQSKKDIKIQTENYLKVFEVYNEIYYSESESKLDNTNTRFFINKNLKQQSDGGDIQQSILFITEDDSEIKVCMPTKSKLLKIIGSADTIEVTYKNDSKNIVNPLPFFEKENHLTHHFAKIWEEFLIHIERSVYYFNELKKVVTPQRIRSIINLSIVQEKYNDYSDSNKMPWLKNYNLAFDWSEKSYVTFRVSEEIQNTEDFDCSRLYFDVFTDDDIRIRYNSSQLNATGDFYSEGSTAIRFLDYYILKRATKAFMEAEKLIIEDDKKYKEELFSPYRKYYTENPIKETELTAINFENLKLIARNCSIRDRNYEYDDAVIIEDYHWISVKWQDQVTTHEITGKRAVKITLLDEPFGNDKDKEEYVAVKYILEIDEDNYLALWSNYLEKVDEKIVQYLLHHLLNEIKSSIKHLDFPFDVNKIQPLLEELVIKKQKSIFKSYFVETKINNGSSFWENGIWDGDYFYSFQKWNDDYLDIRIAWKHPEKAQLDNKTNNMQVCTIRLNKKSNAIEYFFQSTLEKDEPDTNFEWTPDCIEKVYIGYHLMQEKIKLESDYLKEIFERKEKKKNKKVKKPFDKIEIDGIMFSVITRQEAENILKVCKDFDAKEVYDVYDMDYTDEEEDDKAFFLLAENEVHTNKLSLNTYPEDREDIYILGYIFAKPVKIDQYVEAYDTDFSPPIICLENAEIKTLLLSGTTYYFHKNLTINALNGEYNHGALIIQGDLEVELMVVNDFSMKIRGLSVAVLISDNDRNVELYQEVKHLVDNQEDELNYLPGTHRIEDAIKDEFIYRDDKTGEYKFYGGFCANQFRPEGEDDFYELLKKGIYLLDDDKLEERFNVYVNQGFEITKELFEKNPELSKLELMQTHFVYPNPNLDHIMYYFQETESLYIIGYWNTWYHICISMCFSKTGKKEDHQVTQFYWDESNTKVRYNYNVEIDEITYYRNIGQKVFFEVLDFLKKK